MAVEALELREMSSTLEFSKEKRKRINVLKTLIIVRTANLLQSLDHCSRLCTHGIYFWETNSALT